MLSVFDLVDKGGAGGEAVLLEAIVEAALLEAIGEAETSVNVKEVQGAGRRIAPFAQRVEARAARHDAGCSPRPTRSACAAACTLGARKTSRSVAWRTVACSTPSVRAITDALHEQL